MAFAKFSTIANSRFTVSSTVINLADQLRSDGNFNELKDCDSIVIQVDPTNGEPVRIQADGTTPTASLGFYSAGTTIWSAGIADINIIRAGSSDSIVQVFCGKQSSGFNQILS